MDDTVTNTHGKKLKFRVTYKDIEHLVDDALHRAKGVLYVSDLFILSEYFPKALFVKTEKESKKHTKGVCFHYYQIDINGRILFLNFREDRRRRRTTLYSITTKIKKATS